MSISETAISERTTAIINSTATRHGVDPATFTTAQREDARNSAIEQLTHESSPFYQQYVEEKQRRELAESQLNALKTSRTNSNTQAAAKVSTQVVRARMGGDWFRLTDAQRLAAIGADPNTDRELLRKLFGRGAQSSFVVDFSKAQPQRYADLREAALAVGIYGA
jgi:hypothetical protein